MPKNNPLAKIKLISRPSLKYESQIFLKKITSDKEQKPTCNLSLVGDNVFSVINYVGKVLSEAGQQLEADQFRFRSAKLIDYMKVLELAEEFVEICV